MHLGEDLTCYKHVRTFLLAPFSSLTHPFSVCKIWAIIQLICAPVGPLHTTNSVVKEKGIPAVTYDFQILPGLVVYHGCLALFDKLMLQDHRCKMICILLYNMYQYVRYGCLICDVWGMYVKTWLLHCAAEGEFSNLFTVEAETGELIWWVCVSVHSKNIQTCWWCYTCFILFPGAGFKDFSIWGRLWVRQDSLSWNHFLVGWNENGCGAWRKEFQFGLHVAGTWRCGQAWQAGRVYKFASLWCEESWRAAENIHREA